jgi:hypothetical protein
VLVASFEWMDKALTILLNQALTQGGKKEISTNEDTMSAIVLILDNNGEMLAEQENVVSCSIAWLMHSMNCIGGNAKPGAKFCDVIDDSYNSTTDLHHQRTPKNLKDHWCACNKQVSLFNQIYNQESSSR